MDVLFLMRHQGYVKNFESTLELLAQRGHRVDVVLSGRVGGPVGEPTARCLAGLEERHAAIRSFDVPAPEDDRWERFGLALRSGLDWLRYLGPEFAGADRLRARVERRAPLALRRLAGAPAVRSRRGQRALMRGLLAVERSLPVREEDLELLRRHDPDLVVVTPLVDGGGQAGVLRAAHRLGIPAGLCVSSWDNLTSKGLIYGEPDFVTLWNAPQRREAVELHGQAPERVLPTGAQAYDHWFTWEPSRTREAFCAPIGLEPQRPYLLYMCSSGFIAGTREVAFIERWLGELRAHPALRDVGVLVRPHPANADVWRGRDLQAFGNAAVWELDATEPATEHGKRDFFDSIHHSAGVIGLNSSSMVESAIIGRPVFTLLDPEFAGSQAGTLHFEMIAGPDGMLDVASSMDEHLGHLAAAIADPSYGEERRRRFLEVFVRPHGLDRPATDALVGVLEEQGAGSRAPAREPAGRRLLRALIVPATFVAWRSEPQRDAAVKQRRRRRARRRKAVARARRRRTRRLARLRSALRRGGGQAADAPPVAPDAQGERDGTPVGSR